MHDLSVFGLFLPKQAKNEKASSVGFINPKVICRGFTNHRFLISHTFTKGIDKSPTDRFGIGKSRIAKVELVEEKELVKTQWLGYDYNHKSRMLKTSIILLTFYKLAGERGRHEHV
ncbi:hypothetical protein GCM10023183_03290 [Nibribacter koreensis]|uniref:Uncharacterized protein n=1 Tax=Nibribacter koreensis TaxID=1084519 RepID=A0ABP8F6V1_9BACT